MCEDLCLIPVACAECVSRCANIYSMDYTDGDLISESKEERKNKTVIPMVMDRMTSPR